jgi:hypothetical protein
VTDFTYANPTTLDLDEYILDVVPDTSGVDLSTVTAASFIVKRPDGSTATWAATRSNQTATTLTLTYAFLLGDRPIRGAYAIYARLTIPAGTVRTTTDFPLVRGEYE